MPHLSFANVVMCASAAVRSASWPENCDSRLAALLGSAESSDPNDANALMALTSLFMSALISLGALLARSLSAASTVFSSALSPISLNFAASAFSVLQKSPVLPPPSAPEPEPELPPQAPRATMARATKKPPMILRTASSPLPTSRSLVLVRNRAADCTEGLRGRAGEIDVALVLEELHDPLR